MQKSDHGLHHGKYVVIDMCTVKNLSHVSDACSKETLLAAPWLDNTLSALLPLECPGQPSPEAGSIS